MKLSTRWLAQFTPVPSGIKDLADALTLSGSKVETVDELGADISRVVAGLVLSVEKHPGADKLVVCRVDVGQDEPVTIVTGAANVTAGAFVPAALDGSVLPGGKSIKAGKLRGVLSQGMLCSYQELGLTLQDEPDAEPDGIFLLNEPDIIPGTPIQDVLELSDTVLDFEITNNRPDCLSVRGLARETAAVLKAPLTLPEPVVKGGGGNAAGEVKIFIDAPDLCSRYTARLVKNVRIGPSPRWMRRLLRASGLRPINNIVDITNYVLWEYGQPLHAFDFACVGGGEIRVRRAKEGEMLRTLDGNDRRLTPDMLVIADASVPVAVAGVMGGEGSEITDKTVTILFESANFNGPSVRKTAQALNMRTDASGRFEKGLDVNQTLAAVNRACELCELLGAGEVLDGAADVYPVPYEPVCVPFLPDRINAHLGLRLSETEMRGYLESIGCTLSEGKTAVPSFRGDLRIWEDLAEEVARLYGYDNIPATLTVSRSAGMLTPVQQARKRVSAQLRAMGYNEMLTYSFIGPNDYNMANMPPDHPDRISMTILNPLGEETSLMRTTAIPSLLRSLENNLSARNGDCLLYELAVTYHPSDTRLPEERENILFGGYGAGLDFFVFKGQTEALLASLNVKDYAFTAQPDHYAFHPGRCAALFCGETRVGVMGQLHPRTAENIGAAMPLFAAQLDLRALMNAAAPEARFVPLPRFPSISRDLALMVRRDIPQSDLAAAIQKFGGKLLAEVRLFDLYQGQNIPEGLKSMAYALTFRASDRTLTDEEVDRAVEKLLRQLDRELGVILRHA